MTEISPRETGYMGKDIYQVGLLTGPRIHKTPFVW